MSANDELKPCPKCGRTKIVGRVCGGEAAYGCGEYEYEVECPCGILFNTSHMSETAEKAKELGISEWNARAERTCKPIMRSEDVDNGALKMFVARCSECGVFLSGSIIESLAMDTLPNYCSSCGAKVVEE